MRLRKTFHDNFFRRSATVVLYCLTCYTFLKGLLIMTTVPLMDCCELLGIDPKTLRHWLKRANMEFAPHPTDARIKCLTLSQVHHLAGVHARPLAPPAAVTAEQLEGASLLVGPQMPSSPDHACEGMQGKGACTFPTAYLEETDLVKKLSTLETSLATLQDHLAQLALELLHERDLRYERRITALEAVVHQSVGMPASPQSLPDPQATGAGKEWPDVSQHKRSLHPAEQRARSRMPPLIEYTTQGSYI
jgi:hypothetical protein